MQNFTGSYVWHYVDNGKKIEGPKEDHQYLVCFESSTSNGSVWKMRMAFWYEKGARITVTDTNGEDYKFTVKKDGFYVLNEFDTNGDLLFRVRDVKYWTTIPEPGVKPDDILSIV